MLCFLIKQVLSASLVGAADLHRYTQLEWDKTTNTSKADVEKAQKAKDKAEKDKKALKSRCVVLESEKTTLIKGGKGQGCKG